MVTIIIIEQIPWKMSSKRGKCLDRRHGVNLFRIKDRRGRRFNQSIRLRAWVIWVLGRWNRRIRLCRIHSTFSQWLMIKITMRRVQSPPFSKREKVGRAIKLNRIMKWFWMRRLLRWSLRIRWDTNKQCWIDNKIKIHQWVSICRELVGKWTILVSIGLIVQNFRNLRRKLKKVRGCIRLMQRICTKL